MRKKIILYSIPILLIILWFTVIENSLLQEEQNYETIHIQRGEDQIMDVNSGELSEEFLIEEVTDIKIINQDKNILEIEGNVIGTNLSTNELIFKYSETYYVDKNTNRHTDESLGYFTFPKDIQKIDYHITHPLTTAPTNLIFEKETHMEGLLTYEFSCNVDGFDATDSFPEFPEYPVLIDYDCKVFVEPITGTIIDYENMWEAYFIENGERTDMVEIGGKKSTPFTILILSQSVKNEIVNQEYRHVLVPIIIGLISILIFSYTLFINLRRTEIKFNKQTIDLMKKEKLSNIGEITARLAHDLRNPLTVLTATIDLLKGSNDNLDEKQIKNLESASRAVQKMSYQINHVMDYVRTQPLILKNNSLQKLVGSSLESIQVPETVNIKKPENDINILCDFRQIEVVLINLLTNAIQAVQNQGEVQIRGISNNKNIIIEVEDSGPGISENDVANIFEPLFTTKQEGTGLGLVSCKNIVENHGGTLTVKQNPTIFVITLPKQS
jgi:signal transduction histidine kinase